MASIAVFIALGGTGVAAVSLSKNSVRSRNIEDGQVKTRDLARNAVRSSKVANGALLAQDFAPGQLPMGERGESYGPSNDAQLANPAPDLFGLMPNVSAGTHQLEIYITASSGMSSASFMPAHKPALGAIALGS
jgi:hypothetical protein